MNITFGHYPGLLLGMANTTAVYATKPEDDGEAIIVRESAFRIYIPFFCLSFITEEQLFDDEV